MLKHCYLSLTFIFLFSCAQLKKEKFSETLYWEVSKDGKISHILGTVYAEIGINDLPSEINKDFQNSNYFMWEGDNGERRSQWFMKAFKSADRSPIVSDWIKNCVKRNKNKQACETMLLEKERKRRIDDILNLFYNDKKFIQTASVFPYVFTGIPYRALDRRFLEEAASKGKNIVELDANELYWDKYASKIYSDQVDFFYDHEEKIFEKNTLYFRKLVSRYNKIYQTYLKGDFPLPLSQRIKATKQYDFQGMAKERNLAWRNSFFHLFERGKVFMVSGVLNLEGPNGVLELLFQEGFKIKRIRFN